MVALLVDISVLDVEVDPTTAEFVLLVDVLKEGVELSHGLFCCWHMSVVQAVIMGEA